VEYRDLGTATSCSDVLPHHWQLYRRGPVRHRLHAELGKHLAAGIPTTATGKCSPAVLTGPAGVLAQCPAEVQAWFIGAYATAIHIVFLAAVPVGLVAFGMAFLLPEVRLRTATRTTDTGEAFGIPASRTSLQELKLALSRHLSRENDCAAMRWLLNGRMLILSR
jgi:hypothetical protein